MKRVALIGPESTGKSTLCHLLAEHYDTVWVPEYSRDYIGNLHRPYTKDDVLHCIREQIILEKEFITKANQIIFTDNEAINGKVWMLDKYGECPDWIEKEIATNKYDLYLLTSPDIPFVKDAVRENEMRRLYFFDWYKKILDDNSFNYKIINGMKEDRFNLAKEAVDKLLMSKE